MDFWGGSRTANLGARYVSDRYGRIETGVGLREAGEDRLI